MVPFLIVYVGLAVFNVWDIHHSVDLKRCAVDQARFVKVCWPKNGCWLDEAGVAQCWRVVKVKAHR